MSEILRDKKVKVELDRPYATNGYYHGHVDGDLRKPFVGYTEVTPENAEDLERRRETWAASERSRHTNNGRSDVNAGSVIGS